MPLLAVSIVNAAHPMTGSGHVAIASSALISHRVLDDDLVLQVINSTFSITGTLSGKATAIERDLNHTDTRMITFRGLAHFTGTLNGMSGTLLIRYVGVNNSTFIRGHFIAYVGTGQLAGVRGHGSFQGSVTAPLSYTLSWTVRTHQPEHQVGQAQETE